MLQYLGYEESFPGQKQHPQTTTNMPDVLSIVNERCLGAWSTHSDIEINCACCQDVGFLCSTALPNLNIVPAG